jgi:hypothetical protein
VIESAVYQTVVRTWLRLVDLTKFKDKGAKLILTQVYQLRFGKFGLGIYSYCY